jgi:hypothetical protein
MSVAAVLRFTPVYDPRILEVQGLARDVMVQRGALEKIGDDETTRVLVNHDPGRQVGTVREIYIAPTVDGGVVRDWYFASVRLDDPPDWLARHGAVSWGYKALQTQDVKGSLRLLRALITEVSILSPSTAPAESLARVCLVGETSSPAARPSDRLAAGDEVIRHPQGVLLRRPGIGQVIGTR